MSWSYDPALMNSTDVGTYAGSTLGSRNHVRLLLQDTNTSRQLFQDEEIDWTVSQEANAYMAAATLADILVARVGDVKSKKIGQLAIQYDIEFYKTLAVTLRSRGCSHQIPYAGGISKADKQAQESDIDWVQPKFKRGQGDNPTAPQPQTPVDPLTTI